MNSVRKGSLIKSSPTNGQGGGVKCLNGQAISRGTFLRLLRYCQKDIEVEREI